MLPSSFILKKSFLPYQQPSAQDAPQDWFCCRQLLWTRRWLQRPGTNDPRTNRQRLEVTEVSRAAVGWGGGLPSFRASACLMTQASEPHAVYAVMGRVISFF